MELSIVYLVPPSVYNWLIPDINRISESDFKTQELLQILFNAFSTTTSRLVIDHLPKRKYHSVTDTEMIAETASVPTTNVSPEHDFAILDRLMHQKPNANMMELEDSLFTE